MTKTTKKNSTSTSTSPSPILSKAAIKKNKQIEAILEKRRVSRVDMTQENLVALVEKLDRKILASKQAAMICAFHEVEVVDAD